MNFTHFIVVGHDLQFPKTDFVEDHLKVSLRICAFVVLESFVGLTLSA